jgi:N-acetylglucosamine malate deacetylase 1
MQPNDHFDVLAIGAHPDDIDVVMGGTIIKLVASGRSVLMVDLTDGEPTRYGVPGQRAEQAAAAARVLGAQRVCVGLPDRGLDDSIESRVRIADLVRRHRPSIVFTTLGSGVHPDHKNVTDAVVNGVFYARLPNWEAVKIDGVASLAETPPHEVSRLFFGHCRMEPAWDRFDFAVDVSSVYDRKLEAVRLFDSVFSGDHAALLDKYSAEDRYIGSLIGVRFAEQFRSRMPLVVDLPTVFQPARFG